MRTDVLIVGAGPTGLSLACQLIRHGVDFIIIDKKETTTPYSKAIGVQARTLEIYEQMGLADKLIGLGTIFERVRMFAGGKVRGEADFSELGRGLSPYPFALVVEQGKHETLLYDFIKSHGKDVSWQTGLESFTQDESSVTANIRKSGGAAETVRAKYVVGCDGAKSLVRHSLGLEFKGSTFERMFYVADVELDWEFGHDALQVFLMESALLAFFPMKGDRHYRIVGTFPEEYAKDEGDVLYEEIEERIKQDAELDLDITKVNWFSTYKVHTRHVNKFSVGRCFLAGDSAHIHSPAGAQGMNTGIQDGYNLAWKLALVLKGRASLELLNTYNEERLPNAEILTKTTDQFFDLAASPRPLLSFLRIYVFPYVANLALRLNSVKKFVFPRISQIRISYRKSSLSITDGDFTVKAGDRMPYFEVEGKSIYDILREPKFHLLVFNDGTSNAPEINDDFGGLADFHTMPLYPHIAEIFDNDETFCVLLRPDNYIGYIAENSSIENVKDYMKKISLVTGKTLQKSEN